MHYCRTSLLRLSFVVLVVLFIQLSLSISPVLSQDITIGAQVWMTRNLDVSTFRNGDTIFEAKSKEDWVKAGESKRPAFCYFRFNSKYGKQFGKLYNWFAVNDSRGLAPVGYHIPTREELEELINHLGGKDTAAKSLKSIEDWSKGDTGTNSSGFSALPGGNCSSGHFFDDDGGSGYW